jgi:putative ABC transport system permease protein
MKIPVLAGRDFVEQDTEGKRPVVLISASMAKQFWPGENAVGKRFRISFTPDIVREVVGVVGDVKERGLSVLEPVSMVYQPMLQTTQQRAVSLVLRSRGNLVSLTPTISKILQQINPQLPIRDAQPMEQRVANSLSQNRFSMFLFVALAGLAFALAAVGIYSVLAYSVRGRTQEISIRMALGARAWDVLRLVIVEGMKPTCFGVVLGIAGSIALSGILSRLIFGISPTDPLTLGVVTVLLGIVAVLACLVPAWRAVRLQPMQALRTE